MLADTLREQARAIPPGDARDDEARRLMDDERFPSVFSMLLEIEEETVASVSNYDRSEMERTMDAGGLGALREFRSRLEAVLTPPAKEPAPPAPIGEK